MPLPQSTKQIQIGTRTVTLIGTAHLSKASVLDVQQVVEEIHPCAICVELCPARHKALTDKEIWKKMDIFQVIKQGKGPLLLAQVLLSSFYARAGDQLGCQPGAEMMEGVKLATEKNVPLILADRPVDITLRRVWRGLPFRRKAKLFLYAIGGLFEKEELTEESIEELKTDAGQIDVMSYFTKAFPEIKERLIDERDLYLAEKIKSAPGDAVVAIVGAGHLPGISRALHEEHALAPLEEIPPPGSLGKVIKWGLPALLVALILAGFLKGDASASMQSISIWVASHALLAAIGASLAFAHPLAILASALAAPFTSLVPFIAAGWAAALTQAWVKKPTVGDLERVPQEIKTVSGFWKNPTTRILLVAALANFGSSLATIISGTWILKMVLE